MPNKRRGRPGGSGRPQYSSAGWLSTVSALCVGSGCRHDHSTNADRSWSASWTAGRWRDAESERPLRWRSERPELGHLFQVMHHLSPLQHPDASVADVQPLCRRGPQEPTTRQGQ
jgi:hypothetical protein